MSNKQHFHVFLIVVLSFLTACGGTVSEPTPEPKLKVGVVLNSVNENDKSFNEYTLKGAQEVAEEMGLEFTYVASAAAEDYGQNIQTLITEGNDLIITVGFLFGDATAKAARKNPNVHFAIVGNAYFPGFGCADTVSDCYSVEGGLTNVTSLMFAEDEVGYLAGVLAACMSETGTIASVAGMEIPPVIGFVTGYQNGAKQFNPDIVTLNKHIPDFDDPDTGKVIGQDFISQNADVIFGVGGNTGNGGLLAAKEAGHMAIGVDVDQYFTYPEVREVLISSASKKVDIASGNAVRKFANGELNAGIELATLKSGGVGLAPYHDWEDKIPQNCKDAVKSAEDAIIADSTITGGK